MQGDRSSIHACLEVMRYSLSLLASPRAANFFRFVLEWKLLKFMQQDLSIVDRRVLSHSDLSLVKGSCRRIALNASAFCSAGNRDQDQPPPISAGMLKALHDDIISIEGQCRSFLQVGQMDDVVQMNRVHEEVRLHLFIFFFASNYSYMIHA